METLCFVNPDGFNCKEFPPLFRNKVLAEANAVTNDALKGPRNKDNKDWLLEGFSRAHQQNSSTLHIQDTCKECADSALPAAQLVSLSYNSGVQVEAEARIHSIPSIPMLVFFTFFPISMKPKKI